jgi:1,4-dihydroxy-2-naphthoate octaprenyltransferase
MILMLIGVGKWREWRYLAVFVAIPISLILIAICTYASSVGSIVFLLAIPSVISFSRQIQKYYDVSKKSENENSTAEIK